MAHRVASPRVLGCSVALYQGSSLPLTLTGQVLVWCWGFYLRAGSVTGLLPIKPPSAIRKCNTHIVLQWPGGSGRPTQLPARDAGWKLTASCWSGGSQRSGGETRGHLLSPGHLQESSHKPGPISPKHPDISRDVFSPRMLQNPALSSAPLFGLGI